MDIDQDKAWYVFIYYHHLKTPQERLAYSHLVGTAKMMKGRMDLAAQAEAWKRQARKQLAFSEALKSAEAKGTDAAVLARARERSMQWISDDPEVLRLASKGLEMLVVRTSQRILDEHRAEIEFNCCPRCGGFARTPKARHCRFCGFDWHGTQSQDA